MGFQANVLRVMIASPGDVEEERRIVTEEIYKWNDAHAVARKLLLQPVKWETHSTPQLGKPPQAILNEQISEDADILIGIFGTRIGTPTDDYISGTVEEIKKQVAAGKTAKVYFSDVPVAPSRIDNHQYEALQAFKEECRKGGLYATYNDLEGFKDSIRQHLAIELNGARYAWIKEPPPQTELRELALSAGERRILSAASQLQGQITTISGGDGDYINAGRDQLTDGTARSAAIWKETLQLLDARKLIERSGPRPGNYRLTAAGFRSADQIREQEEDNKQLEIELTLSGAAQSQILAVKANKPIRLKQLEFLTSSGACVADDQLDSEGTEASVQISHEKVVKLFNAPRVDRDRNDHSGPALVRLTYTRAGSTNSLELPVIIKPVFVHSGSTTTQFIGLTGQKRFYL